MKKIQSTFDLCTDSTGPMTVLMDEGIRNLYVSLNSRGVKVRMITEIIPENISHVKEFAKIAEIRHLDDVAGNFTIADKSDYAGSPETENGILTKLVVSNVGSFVKLQAYFFETLWNKSIPAQERIDELEKGILPQVTEVGYGPDKAIAIALRFLSSTEKTIDMCGDSLGPAFILAGAPVHMKLIAVQKRGVKIRMIVEIIKENINECKKMFEFAEVRHLDGIRGYSTILDSKVFVSNTAGNGPLIPHVVYSTVKILVEQQQYFFNTLWEKAIPATQRLREIEEGKETGRIELVYDIAKSVNRAFEVMNRTKKELLVLFATSRTFSLAIGMNVAETYRQLSELGVRIRVLVPKGDPIENEMANVRATAPLIELKTSNEDLNTRITIMVSDRKELMSWELRDETTHDPYTAAGVATYSNFETLAGSYATIFENLWKSTEVAENLRVANLNLENKERAMKDFIDIAAHELRTPIQPILGLAENLRDMLPTSTIEHQELLDIIIRNAKRLQQLQEDILDVTKIEGRMLKLRKEKLDLSEILAEIAQDLGNKLRTSGLSLTIKSEPSLNVLADRRRICQVFSNLLGNAIKFAGQDNGEIDDNVTLQKKNRVQVAIQNSASGVASKNEVLVSIRDSGSGIHPDIMPRLFTKFATKSHLGTGLGLYIAKGIIDAHGGRIWAENNNNDSGATFHFTLPKSE